MSQQNAGMANRTNFKMDYGINTGAQVNLLSHETLLLKNSNDISATFNNTVNQTVGGWNFNITALSFKEYTNEFTGGKNARIYSNF